MKRIGTFLVLLLALLGLRPAAHAQTGCAAPTNVRVSSSGSPGNTSAAVSFTPSATALSYTVVYFWSGDTTAAGQLRVTAAGSPVTLTNLRTGSQDYYRARVLSNCVGGTTAPSAQVQFQVGGSGGPGPCGAVSNIVVTATGDSTATVRFTPGAGNTGFQVVVFVTADSSRTRRTMSATASPVMLRRLLPGRVYTVRVTSVCGAGGSVSYTSAGAVSFTQRSVLAARAGLGAGQLSVFPNPAHRAVGLVLPAVPGAAQARLVLLNALGQTVRAQAVPLAPAGDTRAQFDLAGVAPGLYTLRVTADGQAASQRLVVE